MFVGFASLLAFQPGCASTRQSKSASRDIAPSYSRSALLGYETSYDVCVRAKPIRPEEPPQEEFETYTAVRGDSYWSIARKFSVSLDDVLKANGASKASVLRVGQSVQIPVRSVGFGSGSVYVVQRGDSLSSISRSCGCSVGELRQMNGLSGDLLMVGQRINVPTALDTRPTTQPSQSSTARGGPISTQPQTKPGDGVGNFHIVSRGETLSIIAAKYGVAMRDLMELNGISDPNRIVEGQRLSIGGARRPIEQKPQQQRAPITPQPKSQFDVDLLNLFDNDDLFVGTN
jgi:LysM repeat protein